MRAQSLYKFCTGGLECFCPSQPKYSPRKSGRKLDIKRATTWLGCFGQKNPPYNVFWVAKCHLLLPFSSFLSHSFSFFFFFFGCVHPFFLTSFTSYCNFFFSFLMKYLSTDNLFSTLVKI